MAKHQAGVLPRALRGKSLHYSAGDYARQNRVDAINKRIASYDKHIAMAIRKRNPMSLERWANLRMKAQHELQTIGG